MTMAEGHSSREIVVEIDHEPEVRHSASPAAISRQPADLTRVDGPFPTSEAGFFRIHYVIKVRLALPTPRSDPPCSDRSRFKMPWLLRRSRCRSDHGERRRD